jgi:hypothetical protein
VVLGALAFLDEAFSPDGQNHFVTFCCYYPGCLPWTDESLPWLSFAPFGALWFLGVLSQGLRPGLHSFAASRLVLQFEISRLFGVVENVVNREELHGYRYVMEGKGKIYFKGGG